VLFTSYVSQSGVIHKPFIMPPILYIMAVFSRT